MSKIAKRARKPKSTSASGLLDALNFVNLAQVKGGEVWQTHCRISNKTIVAYNGTIAAGCFVEDDLNVCPQTDRFIDVLSKCKDDLSITQLETGRLSVKSGKFRGLVPCADNLSIATIEPDNPVMLIDDSLKTAFAAIEQILHEQNARPFTTAGYLQPGSIVGTDGNRIVEYWHGVAFPCRLLIPKATLKILSKIEKKLSQFGFSDNSATFFFDDNSFIKTQLVSDKYPEFQAVFINGDHWPIPADFFIGLKTISSLCEKIVKIDTEGLHALDENKTVSGFYDLQGLSVDCGFNIEYLLQMEGLFKSMLYSDKKLSFLGDKTRGALMGISNV